MQRAIFFIVCVFQSIMLTGMANSPERAIRDNIQNPSQIMRDLNRFSYVELRNYHDNQYNNLMHITEENDDHETPCFLALKDNKTDDLAENFLVPELHGLHTYASLEPEWRAFKKILYAMCCGCCKRKSKQL